MQDKQDEVFLTGNCLLLYKLQGVRIVQENKSDVARLMKDIELRYESAKQGLQGTAIKGRHDFITHETERILASLEQLERTVGQKEAYRLVFDEAMPEYEKKVVSPDFPSLQKMPSVRLSQFFYAALHDWLELIPASANTPFISRALDVACGSGAWVRECAKRYPDKHFVGLDKNVYLINYAIESAQREKIGNASFIMADMYNELPFHPVYFDVVRLCFLTPDLPFEKALTLLTNLSSYLFWTGKLVWIEPSIPTSSSYALFSYLQYIQEAYAHEDIHVYTLEAMEALVRQASFKHVTTLETEVSFSAGTKAHTLIVEYLPYLLASHQQVIKDMGLATSSELQSLIEQISHDLASPDFTGSCTFTTVVAEKTMPTGEKNKVR